MAKSRPVYEAPPPKRFAIGAPVRICRLGLDGTVTAIDDKRTLWQYMHTVMTKNGEYRELGSRLELIPPSIGSPLPWSGKLADTIHISGPNSRLNLNSVDNSTNAVSHEPLFSSLRESASVIEDPSERENILACIADLEAAHGTGEFLPAYQTFIGSVADHLTIFAAIMPELAMLLSNHLRQQ